MFPVVFIIIQVVGRLEQWLL